MGGPLAWGGGGGRVLVLADIQNFTLRAHCVCTACMAFPHSTLWSKRAGHDR